MTVLKKNVLLIIILKKLCNIAPIFLKCKNNEI